MRSGFCYYAVIDYKYLVCLFNRSKPVRNRNNSLTLCQLT